MQQLFTDIQNVSPFLYPLIFFLPSQVCIIIYGLKNIWIQRSTAWLSASQVPGTLKVNSVPQDFWTWSFPFPLELNPLSRSVQGNLYCDATAAWRISCNYSFLPPVNWFIPQPRATAALVCWRPLGMRLLGSCNAPDRVLAPNTRVLHLSLVNIQKSRSVPHMTKRKGVWGEKQRVHKYQHFFLFSHIFGTLWKNQKMFYS